MVSAKYASCHSSFPIDRNPCYFASNSVGPIFRRVTCISVYRFGRRPGPVTFVPISISVRVIVVNCPPRRRAFLGFDFAVDRFPAVPQIGGSVGMNDAGSFASSSRRDSARARASRWQRGPPGDVLVSSCRLEAACRGPLPRSLTRPADDRCE